MTWSNNCLFYKWCKHFLIQISWLSNHFMFTHTHTLSNPLCLSPPLSCPVEPVTTAVWHVVSNTCTSLPVAAASTFCPTCPPFPSVNARNALRRFLWTMQHFLLKSGYSVTWFDSLSIIRYQSLTKMTGRPSVATTEQSDCSCSVNMSNPKYELINQGADSLQTAVLTWDIWHLSNALKPPSLHHYWCVLSW